MSAMGFNEEINSFNHPVDYLDEVANIIKKFPTNQIQKLEIIREKQINKVKFPKKRTSSKIKIKFSDLLKQFNCDHSNCNHTVTVFSQGPKLRNKKHRHRFVLNSQEI